MLEEVHVHLGALHGVHRLGFNGVTRGVLLIGGRCPGEPVNPLLREGVRSDAREVVPETSERRQLQGCLLSDVLKGALGEPGIVGPHDRLGMLVAIGEVKVAHLLTRGCCRHDATEVRLGSGR